MKKRVLGVIAAAFLFVTLLPLTASAANTAYAILYEDGTLVFQNSNTPESGREVKKTYEVDLDAVYTPPSNYAPWHDEHEFIRVVDFASTVSPTSTASWFFECAHLERVENIQNLDTVNVTNMGFMFCSCLKLAALDVSHFDTANVTDMRSMFGGCLELTALDVSHFNTANVTDMSSMFCVCTGLTALDVSRFDTDNVKSMFRMFDDCRELTALDVSHFDTSKVISMVHMFANCPNLKTIYASEKFTTASVIYNEGMFKDCASLVGGAGTKYNENYTDTTYARIDTASAPGYFTGKVFSSGAYEITSFKKDIAQDKKSLQVSVGLANANAAQLAIACFDADGRFLSVNLQDVPADVGTATASVPANAKAVRVMLWDNARRPLCAAFKVTF